MTRPLDLRGQAFARLTVLERVGSTPGRSATWLCRCECGTETVVPSNSLRSGNTKSCGCLRQEVASLGVAVRNLRDVVGYAGAHVRVRRIKGTPSDHSCVDCGVTAEEWSYTKADPDELTDGRARKFSSNPEFYVARCRSCHRRLDSHSLPTAV